MYNNLTRESQLETTKNWNRPNVFPTGVIFPYRNHGAKKILSVTDLLRVELLPARRKSGSGTGNIQCHHGGILNVTDQTPVHAAVRELLEETGYKIEPSELQVVGIIGPEFYRATCSIFKNEDGTGLELIVSNEPANPKHPYLFNVFATDVTDLKPSADTDGEIELLEWMTIDDLIREYGQSLKFNYWTLVAMLGQRLISNARLYEHTAANIYRDFEPGEYFPW